MCEKPLNQTMTNIPANSHNNPTPQQTDGNDQSKQHASPKDQLKTLTAHVLLMVGVFGLLLLCCTSNCTYWYVQELRLIWVTVTHVNANETRNSRSFCLHLLSHGVNFQLPLKEAAKVFWFFQELPGNSTPDLPTRGPFPTPVNDARCPPVCRQDRSSSDKMGSNWNLQHDLEGPPTRGIVKGQLWLAHIWVVQLSGV